jgi:hypothetical protein
MTPDFSVAFYPSGSMQIINAIITLSFVFFSLWSLFLITVGVYELYRRSKKAKRLSGLTASRPVATDASKFLSFKRQGASK